MSTKFKHHTERSDKARTTIKAYTTNSTGIDKETKTIIKNLEGSEIAIIRLPTFQSVTPSPSSALNAMAILLADNVPDGITVKYIHVRRAHRDKKHATALLHFISEFAHQKIMVQLTSASGFDTILLWLKAGFQVQEWSETSIFLQYMDKRDVSHYITSFVNDLLRSDNEWARTTLLELVKEGEEKEPVLEKIAKPVSIKHTIEGSTERAAKTRPRGRAPNSNVTKRPMVWVNGAWAESIPPGDNDYPTDLIKATRTVAAKGPRGNKKKGALANTVCVDSSDEEEDEMIENARSEARAAIKRNLPNKAFFLYCNNKRAKVQSNKPYASRECISDTLADKWLAITDERRKKYVEQTTHNGPGSSESLALHMRYYGEYKEEAEESEEEVAEVAEVVEEKSSVAHFTSSTISAAQGLSPPPPKTDEEFVPFPPADDRVDSNGILRKEPDDKEDMVFELSEPGDEKMIDLDGRSFRARFFSSCSVNGVPLLKGETIYLLPDEKDESCEIASVNGFYRNEENGDNFVDAQWCFRPEHLTVAVPFPRCAQEVFLSRGASDLISLDQFEGKCNLTAVDVGTDAKDLTFPPHSYFYRYHFTPNTNSIDPVESYGEIVD
jgi:hypothetical protein